MSCSPRRTVPTHKSPRPVGATRGDDHRDTAWRRFINSRAWRACSAAYLARHPCCVRCLARGDLVEATQTHHTKGQDTEHAFDEDTFEALCSRCHSRETMVTMNEAKSGDEARTNDRPIAYG